jgi:hypothetical protein
MGRVVHLIKMSPLLCLAVLQGSHHHVWRWPLRTLSHSATQVAAHAGA